MKCPKCNYENKEDALTCGLCSELLKTKSEPTAPPPDQISPAASTGGRSCPNHPGRPIAWFCSSCKKDHCAECLVEEKGKKLCPNCRGKKFTDSRYYRARESEGETIKTLWSLIGLALIINYLIPFVVTSMGTFMFWSFFNASFTAGFVCLLPTLCGGLLLIVTIFVRGKPRGVTIGLAGLITLLFYYAVGSANPVQTSSASQPTFQGSNIFILLGLLTFILVLVGAQLRTNYEQSDTARLLGGIAGSVFLISVLILILELLSSVPSEMLKLLPLSISKSGLLPTFTSIVFIVCSIGLVISSILSVVNLGQLSNSSAIASYSFTVGVLSIVALIGWLLVLPIIIIILGSAKGGVPSSGEGWGLFLHYRMFLMFGAPVFMFGTGMYDWLKRYMPSG